jgi:hypothetical protein
VTSTLFDGSDRCFHIYSIVVYDVIQIQTIMKRIYFSFHWKQQLIDWISTPNRSEYVSCQFKTEFPFQRILVSDFLLKYPYHLSTVVSDASGVSRMACIISNMCNIFLLMNYNCEDTLLSSSHDRTAFSSNRSSSFVAFSVALVRWIYDITEISITFQLDAHLFITNGLSSVI